MRVILNIWLVLLLAITVGARSFDFKSGTSPNGLYRVQLVQRGSHISYDIVSTQTGALLHRIPSSYQPTEPADRAAWKISAEADIAWSPDSRYVSIDEENVHRGGDLFIALVTARRTEAVPLPEAAILAATRLESRYRIRHNPETWIASDRLSLGLAGRTPDGYTRLFDFVLQFRDTKAELLSIHEST